MHLPTRSGGECFAKKLTGDSHPAGRLIEGVAAGVSRLPFWDRSTMVIRLGWVMAAEWEGSTAPADSNKLAASATTAITALCPAIHLILPVIFNITPTPQPDVNE
jgi:hypothetical protein